jgi:O-antigen/teichoic acid export membrane protein
MMGRAVAISATRLMNYGLLLISPMVLVRLLSEQDFGRYREFLVYSTLFAGIAAFGINSSLLKFVPGDPAAKWRYVFQANLMTLASSVIVTAAMLLANLLFKGELVGEYAVPVALYVLVAVNLDFWEFLWLAEKYSTAVLRYTTARLVARIVVVIGAAASTRDVTTIVYALIGLEAVRLAISAIAWRSCVRRSAHGTTGSWREQWKYCLPFGSAMVAVSISKSIAPMFVAKMMGPAALAQYAIGTYLQPVVNVVRNSLSDVVLPEMSSKAGQPQNEPLRLWQRTSVVTAIFMFPITVLLARFAETLIVTLFSDTYLPAVPVFQIYLLVFLRETIDFGVPLRAINRNAPILHSTSLSIAVRLVLLVLAIPIWGLVGAVTAVVIARFVEGSYLAARLARAYDESLRSLVPWWELFKILAAAVFAGAVIYPDFWTKQLGFFGIIPASALYLVLFVLFLSRLKIPEVSVLLSRLRDHASGWLHATGDRLQ